MTDLIDAEIAAVKRNGPKENAKKNEVTYFIDHSRSRREDEERARKKAEEERAKKLALEKERNASFRNGKEIERRQRRSRSPYQGRRFPRRSSRSPPGRYDRRQLSPKPRRHISRSPSPRHRVDRAAYRIKRFSRSPPRRRDNRSPFRRRESRSPVRQNEKPLPMNEEKPKKIEKVEEKQEKHEPEKFQGSNLVDKERQDNEVEVAQPDKTTDSFEKPTIMSKEDSHQKAAKSGPSEPAQKPLPRETDDVRVPHRAEESKGKMNKNRSKSRDSRGHSISSRHSRRRSRSIDRKRPRRGSRGSDRELSRSRRSKDRKHARSRSKDRKRSKSKRSSVRRRSPRQDRGGSRHPDSKRRRSKTRSRSSSTSSSSSSSSASSSSSTALIQQILAQNAKGALAVQQHKNSQRHKKNAETAELIKAQAIALSQGALALSNSPMEVVKRQLYVGGLPIGIQPTALVDFLNEAMMQRKLSTSDGNPVLRANLNGDGSFGFVTLRSIEETDAALLHLNGIQCLGQSLKIGRPKNYEGSGPSPDILGVPLQPLNLGSNDAQTLLMHLEKKLQETYKETGVPSPVIKIANMLTTDMVKDQEELDDVKDDVKNECQSYGTVVEVRLPNRGDVDNLFVYVHMATKSEAQVACDKLSGRSFDGRALKVTFCPLAEFLGEESATGAKAQEKGEPNFVAVDID